MTTENGVERLKDIKHYLHVLCERRSYLHARVEERLLAGENPNGYHEVEIKALDWAIPVLEAERDSVVRLRKFILQTEGRNSDDRELDATWMGRPSRKDEKIIERSNRA